MAKTQFPADVFTNPNVIGSNNLVLTVLPAYLREQMAQDYNDISQDLEFGFVTYPTDVLEIFKRNNQSVAQYFISTETLTLLLFNSSFSGDNAIRGLRIWFQQGSKDLLLVRARAEDGLVVRDLESSKKAVVVPPIFQKTVNTIKANPPLQIRGYYFGRKRIMRLLADSEGNLNGIAGIELDVRKNAEGKYSIILYTAKNNYVGVASFTVADMAGEIPFLSGNVPVGGMSGTRPCPPLCGG